MISSDAADLYRQHVGSVYRLCFSYLRNTADTEDAVQETFVRLIRSGPSFESDTHSEGWLIRTAANVCKDVLKRASRRHEIGTAEQRERASSAEVAVDATLGAVLDLPERYKAVVYLYYYAGYSTAEIAKLLDARPSTVRNRLADARAILRQSLGDFDEE